MFKPSNLKNIIFILSALFLSLSSIAQQKGYGFSYKFLNDSLKVDRVFENSPAAKAGIKTNDLIEKINGTSIKGKTKEGIAGLIGERDKTNFTIKRGKQMLNISASKALTAQYDRKCLKGDCINGEGKALLLTENRIYEGGFINGAPSGKVKIYSADNKLMFDGNIVNGRWEGEGKYYYDNGEEKNAGIYKNGEFIEGFTYYQNGKIFSKGKYEKGNLVSGYFKTTYRGKPVFLFCNKIENFGTNQEKYYGEVIRRADVPGGVIVSKGNYNGVWKHGWFEEYEYENDSKFVLHYNQGAIWPGDAKIYRISDGKLIGEKVMFPRNATDFGREIEGGTFKFAEKGLYVGAIDKYHTIADLKEEYYSKYGGATDKSDIAGTLLLFYSARGGTGVVHGFTIHSKSSLLTYQIESIVSELRAKHGDKLTTVGFIDYTFVPGFACSKTMGIAGKSPNGNSYSDENRNTIYCLEPYYYK